MHTTAHHALWLTFTNHNVEQEYRQYLAINSIRTCRLIGTALAIAFLMIGILHAIYVGYKPALCFLPGFLSSIFLALSTRSRTFFCTWIRAIQSTSCIVTIVSTIPWFATMCEQFSESHWTLVISIAISLGWSTINIIRPVLPLSVFLGAILCVLVILPEMLGHRLSVFSEVLLVVQYLFMFVLLISSLHMCEYDARQLWLNSKILEATSKETVNHITTELTETKRSSDLIIAYISHEVRNPLNGIANMVTFVLDSLHSLSRCSALQSAEQEIIKSALNDCDQIRSCCDIMTTVVNDALDICKLEEGNMKFTSQRVTCGELLSTMESVMGDQFRAKGIVFTVDVDKAQRHFTVQEPLHPIDILTADISRDSLDDESVILCDVKRVKQVVLNLLTNALKYTERGSVRLRIALQMVSEGDSGLQLVCEVHDTGSGISESGQKTLFQPFKQLDHTNRMRGLGLGLYLCRLIITAMGGQISCTSQVGVGSTFRFTIPVELIPSNALDGPTLTVSSSQQDINTARRKVKIQVEGLEMHLPEHSITITDDNCHADDCLQTPKHLPNSSRIFSDLDTLESVSNSSVPSRMLAPSSPPLLLPLVNSPVLSRMAFPVVLDSPLPSPMTPSVNPSRGLRILVVDDVLLNRNIVKRHLERVHHVVATAVNGQDALDVVHRTPEGFDYVFMDINMPVMNGLEATARLKQMGVTAQVIGLSGDRSENVVNDCLAVGMTRVIAKPVAREDILACLV